MTIGQAMATQQRLAAQTRDTTRRGKGSKAARRAARSTGGGSHKRGLSRRNRTVSRAQQRYLFARYGARARQWTSRGRYARLPERKSAPTVRSSR